MKICCVIWFYIDLYRFWMDWYRFELILYRFMYLYVRICICMFLYVFVYAYIYICSPSLWFTELLQCSNLLNPCLKYPTPPPHAAHPSRSSPRYGVGRVGYLRQGLSKLLPWRNDITHPKPTPTPSQPSSEFCEPGISIRSSATWNSNSGSQKPT